MFKLLSSYLFIFFLGCSISSTLAQEKEITPQKFTFGKIDPSEFALKPTGSDSSAAAIAIFDIGTGLVESYQLGSAYIMKRHVRYKIMNKQGYDYGNLELQTYRTVGGHGTVVSDMEGATYNLENGKVIVSKIAKDAKFTERQDKNYSIKKYVLPNLKEGCIVEFAYTTKMDFAFRLRPWYFQHDVPTLYSAFILGVPDLYSYKVNLTGYENVTSKTDVGEHARYYRFTATNVPALKSESYITTMDDYATKVNFELATYRDIDGMLTDYTSTWPAIVKLLKNDASFGGFIGKNSFAKSLLTSILKGETNKDSIVIKVFDYIKNNIKWDKDYGLYSSNSNPKNILEKKVGNSADINLILLILLKEAKIDATPLLVSTRDNGTHPGMPLISGFNSVIVEAVVDDKHLLLDATDKNHCINLIAYNHLNHEALCIDLLKESGKWISIEKEKMSSKVYSYMLSLDESNKLSGKLFITSTDYEALKAREKYLSSTNQAEFLKAYKSDKPGLQLKNYEILNLHNSNEALTESMDVEIEDNVEEAGNLTYFTPLLFERTKENPFVLENRKFPVDFAYPLEEVYRITIELPKDYKVDKVLTSEKYVLPDNDATFSFSFSQTGNTIGIISKISIRRSTFSPEQYFDLKELFKNIVRKQAEQIVIKKS